MQSGESEQHPLYRHTFGAVQFDEARSELRVDGKVVDMEQRPAQVLACLLRHADEVVSRQELFDTVWGGRPTVDNVLANAVAKLRKALGEADGKRILNVPRVGYRLLGPVTRTVSGRRLHSRLDLVPGQAVPGRAHMQLREQLGPAHDSEAWLARHVKTGELRVYKFSTDGDRLDVLKREVTIYRLLRESLGPREDFARVIDWNLEQAPFWLECEYAGTSLQKWAEQEDGLATLSQDQRIELFLQVADAIAAAHEVGVLHKDIKPANVLVTATPAGTRVRITDFGSSRLLEPGRLEALGITALGLTMTHALDGDSSGTPLYLAPELLSGQPPTVQSDIYALGLILYQLIVGDLRRPLAPGWEADVDDELLREDIAAGTDGSPARRLKNVTELCERLRGRAARQIERQRLRDAEVRAQLAEHKLERSHARRPWVIAAMLLLLIGLTASTWQYLRASAARDEAERQAAIATATNRFLNDDLLGAGNDNYSPAWYERNPRLNEILDAAASRLDKRYTKAPLLAAGLHYTLAMAYRTTGEYKKAATQLQSAATLFAAKLGADAERSILAEYALATMEAHLSQFAEANARLDRADARIGSRRSAMTEVGLRSHLARGNVQFQQMQVSKALANYRAAEIQRKVLHPADMLLAGHLVLSIAGCQLRLQHPKDAERMVRALLADPRYNAEKVGLGSIALARKRLAAALRAQGQYAKALPVLKQAVDDFTYSQGRDGQATISALSDVGYVLVLLGEDAKALDVQRDVYQRALHRWGAKSQFTLVELLNLSSQEHDAGDFEKSLAHAKQAEAGLVAVSGSKSPTVQAARVALANVLNDMGRQSAALAMMDQVDPVAYQATTTTPGRAAVLQAMRARFLLSMGKRTQGEALMKSALQQMQTQGAATEEIAAYRGLLDKPVATQGAALP